MSAPPARRQSGFTLVEVLVSLLLLSLLSLISWRALDGVERGSERLDAVVDETQAISRVLGQMGEDIARHAGPEVLPEPPAPQSRRPAVRALLPPGIQVAQSGAGRATLSMIRASPALDGTWERVVWRLDGDALRRGVGKAGIALPLPQPMGSEAVLGGIRDFSVRAWMPGHGWVAPDTPPGAARATGLELTIGRLYRGRPAVFRKVVLLP